MSKFLISCFVSLTYLAGNFLQADTAVEFRVGAFVPTDSRFQDIYGDVQACYEIEASTSLCNDIDLWTNFDYLTTDGRVKHCGKSTLDMYSVSIGPKMNFCLNTCMNFYAGIGLSVASVRVHNHFCCSDKETKASWGGVIKTGVNMGISDCTFLDVFADYVYQPVSFHRNANVGGFRLGAGVGVVF